jgi:hypothetical protein
MDVLGLQAAVESALAAGGVVQVWTGMVVPLLTGLGDREVERQTAEVVAGCLHRYAGQLWARRPPDPAARPVLLATLPGEPHTLPLLALAAALAERQVLGQVLGAGVPAEELTAAATRCRPAAVVVWAGTVSAADPLAMAALTRDPPAYRVVAAGPAWPSSVHPAHTLADAVCLLAPEG